ncbi:MAG: LEPR-XLL domain-containing protein, partial [Verrucomicrobiota bacterium]
MNPKRRVGFGIENLESRILLSATPVDDGSAVFAQEEDIFATTLHADLGTTVSESDSLVEETLLNDETEAEELIFEVVVDEVAENSQTSQNAGTVTISGTTPGVDYTQNQTTGEATLSGTLAIEFGNDFTPELGDEFILETYDSVVGSYDSATGLFGFGDGSLYLRIIQGPSELKLVAEKVPGPDLRFTSSTATELDQLATFLNRDYFSAANTVDFTGVVALENGNSFSGTFTISEAADTTVDITTGQVAADFSSALLSALNTVGLNTAGTLIEDVSVDVLEISATNVQSFVGFGEIDWTMPLSEQTANGFHLTGLDFGMVVMTPGWTDPLLSSFSFAAVQASGATVSELNLSGLIQLDSSDIDYEANLGINWADGLKAGTVDFSKSFETTADAADGSYDVGPTGLANINFGGGSLAAVTFNDAQASLIDLVDIRGDLRYELAGLETIDIQTNIPANLANAADLFSGLDTIGDEDGVTVSSDYSLISGVIAQAANFTLANGTAFIGFGDAEIAADGSILNGSDLTGFSLSAVNLAAAIFTPTNTALGLPDFIGLKANATNLKSYGFDDIVDLESAQVNLEINKQIRIPGGIPVVDFPELTLPTSLDLPELFLPDLQLPDLSLPDLTLPTIDIPSLGITGLQLPSISLPDLTFPEVALPSINLPSVSLTALIPSIDLGDITLPAIDLPDLDLGSIDLSALLPSIPDVSLPSLSLPSFQLPDLNIPSIDLGTIDLSAFDVSGLDFLPDLDLGTLDLTIDLPKLSLPDLDLSAFGLPNLELPDLELPQITLPTINLPTINLPDIDLSGLNLTSIDFGILDLGDLQLPSISLPSIALPNLDLSAFSLHDLLFPSIDFPGLTIPDFELPDIDLPTISLPDLFLPDLDFSALSLPDFEFPSISLGSINLPEIELPDLSLPKLSIPEWNLANFALPTISLPSITLPTFSLPNLTLPDFDLTLPELPTLDLGSLALPDITLPSISLPSIELPTIDLSGLNLTGLSFSSIDFPTISLPDLNLGDLSLPSLDLP